MELLKNLYSEIKSESELTIDFDCIFNLFFKIKYYLILLK